MDMISFILSKEMLEQFKTIEFLELCDILTNEPIFEVHLEENNQQYSCCLFLE
tara:strand:+ start:434 stop:592 length:159 start_codon:yes stop_codon:yes gene_type:complete